MFTMDCLHRVRETQVSQREDTKSHALPQVRNPFRKPRNDLQRIDGILLTPARKPDTMTR